MGLQHRTRWRTLLFSAILLSSLVMGPGLAQGEGPAESAGPPVVDAGPDQTVFGHGARINEGGSALHLGPANFTPTVSAAPHSARIKWGDGTDEPGIVSESGGSGTVSGSHSYRRTGTVVVTVTNQLGDTGRDSFEVNVRSGGPSAAGSEGSGKHRGPTERHPLHRRYRRP